MPEAVPTRDVPKREHPEGGEPPAPRKSRTIGGLAVNVASHCIFVTMLTLSAIQGPVYGTLSGELLDGDLVEAGRARELDLMKQFGVYERVRNTDALGKRVRSKWLDDYKIGEDGQRFVRSRLVAMEIAWDARSDTFAGTPPLKAVRLGLALA